MPIVLRTGLSPIKWEHMATINRILDIWIVVAIALLVSAFMSGINRVYEKMASVRDKPVKIITQVITVVIWCAVALIIISINIQKTFLENSSFRDIPLFPSSLRA